VSNERAQHRITMRKMLIVEAGLRRRLGATLASNTTGIRSKRRTPEHSARALAESLARDIHLGRGAARNQSHRTLLAEVGDTPLDLRRVDAPQDLVRSHAIAAGLAAAWLTKVHAGESHRAAAKALRARLDTIAATETAQAFNAEREAETDAAALGAPPGTRLLKVWDATLDRRVCPTCSTLDGTEVPWGHDFPGGAVPGSTHPNCRCVELTRVITAPMATRAVVSVGAALAALAALPAIAGANFHGQDAEETVTPFQASEAGAWEATKVALPEAQRAKVTAAVTRNEGAVERRLPLADLLAGQPTIRRESVRAFLDNPKLLALEDERELPVVARLPDGRLLILDGHHRLTARRLLGQKTARVTFIDVPKLTR
jgi:hypothetical protein